MKLMLWSTYVKHPVGGMERTSLELALQLHQRGHDVVLVGPFDNAPELRAKIPTDMPYYYFDMHRTRLKPHMKAARLASRLIRQHSIELVSAHGSIFALDEVCRHFNIPMVWTIHGAGERSTKLLERLKTAAVGRVMSHRHCHVVGVSRATSQIVGRQFPQLDQKRLHFIHTGGMDDAALLDLALPKAGPPWRIGFIGRVVEQKRPLDLVPIARALEGRLDFSIHVFGDGPLLNPLRASIREAQLDHRFVLHGYWDAGRSSMIEQIHLLVHPAGDEPLGLVLIEANLGGRPVAAYGVGGIPEIVDPGVTGLLVPMGDTQKLTDAVCELAGPRYGVFCQAARERTQKYFTLEQMIDQYEALFKQLCVSH